MPPAVKATPKSTAPSHAHFLINDIVVPPCCRCRLWLSTDSFFWKSVPLAGAGCPLALGAKGPEFRGPNGPSLYTKRQPPRWTRGGCLAPAARGAAAEERSR